MEFLRFRHQKLNLSIISESNKDALSLYKDTCVPVSLDQWFSNLNVQNLSEGLIQRSLLGPSPISTHSVSLKGAWDAASLTHSQVI